MDTLTETATRTDTETVTETDTATETGTASRTPTATRTPTESATATSTESPTETPSNTATATLTPTILPAQTGVVAYPNPARGGAVTLLFWVRVASEVTVLVHNVAWEPAAEIRFSLPAGYSTQVWSYGRLPPGVYLYRAEVRESTGGVVRTRPKKLTIER